MNSYISILEYKLKSIFDRRKSVTAIVMCSELDRTSAIRNHCRVYASSVGRYTYIARNTLVQNAKIGNFCSISEGCNIGMPSHPTWMLSTSPVFLAGSNYLHVNFANTEYDDCPQTIIENDVWIGAGASIKSGIQVGNGAIIAAGAVVVKDVPPYAIVGGVPAKVIRNRFDPTTAKRLLDLEWWNWSEADLAKRSGFFRSPQELLVHIDKLENDNGKV